MLRSLSGKLFLTYLGAISIVVGLSWAFFAGEFRRQAEEEYAHRARRLLENCSAAIERLGVFDNVDLEKSMADPALRRALVEALEGATGDADIFFAGFYGIGGEALVEVGDLQRSNHFGHLRMEEWAANPAVRESRQEEGGEMSRVLLAKPIFSSSNEEHAGEQGHLLGYLSVGISLLSMEGELRQNIIYIMKIAIGLGLLSAIFIFFMSRRLLQPQKEKEVPPFVEQDRQEEQRVREVMEGKENIESLLSAIKKSLDLLEIEFYDCGINLQATSGAAILPYNLKGRDCGKEMPVSKGMLKSFDEGCPLYRPDLLAENLYEEARDLHKYYDAPIRSVIDVPFARGTLMINSLRANAFSAAQIAYLQALAKILDGGEQCLLSLQQLLQARFGTRGDDVKVTQAAIISHELSNLVNGIIDQTESLLGEEVKSEQKGRLELIGQSAELLKKQVFDLGDLSRGEPGGVALGSREFALREVLQHLVDIHQVDAQDKGLALEMYIDPQVPEWLSGDELKMRQVLKNLIGNAIKFTKIGEVKLVVGFAGEDAGMVLLSFKVQDTGIGIPVDRQERIFQASVRADEAGVSRDGGRGFGLSIAAQLVDIMGGRIHVESEEGKGTFFQFVLPLEIVGNGGGENDEAQRLQERDSLRVLLAEDNKVNQMVTKNLLELVGHRVTAVDNGREAIAAFASETFDLILMDINMPEIDGVEAASEIRVREEKSGQHVPILALSGDVNLEDRERFLSAGIDDCLVKPLQADELAEVVMRLGGGGRQISESTAKLEAWEKLEWMASQGQFSVAHYVRIFLQDGPQRLANLRKALGADDGVSLEREAHTLKGGAREFGAVEMASLCQELEDMGESGDLKSAADLLVRLETAYAQLRDELERKVAEKGAS